ncbi:MAG: ABC transporter permease [Armatimonadota bacterium]|nr:ABC transporter permease [Armatimonadota bacterium]MDR5697614.1 ABC transporter permease [Armatimonadota bacterium]
MGVRIEAGLRAVGAFTLRRLEEIGDAAIMLGRVVGYVARLNWEPRETLRQMGRAGADSVPIILLTGLFSGMVLAFQTANQLLRLGGEGFVGGLIAVSMAREAAPVFTAIVIAGRVGAGFAAEIGTMAVTEQVDALRVMGTDPIRYLVLPRVLALVTMLPVLVLFANVIGYLGGYGVSILAGVPGSVYLSSVRQFLKVSDVTGGLVKAAAFGLLTAMVSCRRGLHTTGGADGVGRSTTGAVVAAITLILVANYFLDILLF